MSIWNCKKLYFLIFDFSVTLCRCCQNFLILKNEVFLAAVGFLPDLVVVPAVHAEAVIPCDLACSGAFSADSNIISFSRYFVRYRAILTVLLFPLISCCCSAPCQKILILKNHIFLSREKLSPPISRKACGLCGCKCVVSVLRDSLTSPKISYLVHGVVLAVFLLVAVIVPIPR